MHRPLADTGMVVGVSDGDTITVLDYQRVQHRVRLAGIATPAHLFEVHVEPSDSHMALD